MATATDWKPISTAPKDGSDVLLYLPSTRQRVGFFSSKGEWQTSASFNKVTPSHWMALPKPPDVPKAPDPAKP